MSHDPERVPDPAADPRGFLRALDDAAVQRALPSHVMAEHLPPPPDAAKGRTVVLGAGKAGGAMAAAADALWPAEAPLSGLVVTRCGHVPPVSACASTSRPSRAGGWRRCVRRRAW